MNTDELAPLFESRETRLGRLPEQARTNLQVAAESAKSTGQADFEDQQFVSLWLSRRTGLPRKDVLANFGNIAGRYFGEGATAAQAYDAISKYYKGGDVKEPVMESENPEAFAGVDGLAKVGKGAMMVNTEQSARSAAGGFAQISQQIPAGIYSQAATVMASPGRAKSPFENRTYLDLHREREELLHPPFQPRDTEVVLNDRQKARLAKIDADMATLRGRTDEENRTRLKEYNESTGKDVSEEYRRLSKFWYDLSGDAINRAGVNPEFQKTTLGRFMQSVGSVPATAALAAMGPVGAFGMESSFFGQVEQERMGVEGEAYDPEKAFSANIASAGPQMVLERAFGLERLMASVVKDVPKVGGKILFGDMVKQFVKQGLVSGAEEGLTEPAQNFWNDFVASQTYNQKRELFTEDAAKQRLVESISAFTLGFVFAGGVRTVENVDRNMTVAKGEKYLTTREGQTLTPADFSVLRQVRSDEDLMATAPNPETGRLLIAAANGDESAMAKYNDGVLREKFVSTDGLEVDGFKIGMIDGVPVIENTALGSFSPLDMNNPEERQFFDTLKQRAVAEQATKETLAGLQERMGETLAVERPAMPETLADRVAKGLMTQEEAQGALEVAKLVNGLAKETTLETAAVKGLADVRQTADGVFQMVATVAQAADPTVAIEEVSEAYIKKAYLDQNLKPEELNDARMKWHSVNGETDVADGLAGDELARANIEWFSKRVVDYALARRKVTLPGGWGKWLRTLGERLKTVIRGAAKMKKLLREGKLDADLEALMKGALGEISAQEATAGITERRTGQPQQVPMNGQEGGLMSTFSLSEGDYRGQHGAPMRDSGSPMYNVVGVYPEDVYSSNGLRYYSTGQDAYDREAYALIQSMRNRPNAKVTVYRAVPKSVKGGLNRGDWVTPIRGYAKEHGEGALGGDMRIIKETVAARDLFTAGDSWLEWGYDPQPVDEAAKAVARAKRDASYLARLQAGEKIVGINKYEGDLYFGKDDEAIAAFKPKPGAQGDTTFSLAQTETPEFRAWFKDSKVVDADGKPLVVYHGTRSAEFSQFVTPSFFTSDPKAAGKYAEKYAEPADVVAEGGRTLPVYLSIQNPKRIGQFQMMGIDEASIEKLKADGFDGAMFTRDDGVTVAMAFDPAQIKSAIGNRGTFDPNSPDITFATTGIPQNATQSLQAQAMAIQAKRLAASAQLLSRLNSGQPLPARAKAVRKSTEASLAAKLFVPLVSRLQAISETANLGQRLRRFDFDLGQAVTRDFQAVKPFMVAFENLPERDARILDLALKNGDTASRDAVLNAHGMVGAFARVEQVLSATRQRAIAAGYDVGEIQDYFPRKVNDYEGLHAHYYGTPAFGAIEQALKDAADKAQAQGRILTREERIEVVNSTLRGFRRGESKPGNLKARKTDVVDVDADQFYADSVEALVSYVENLNTAIEKRRFFGKFAVPVAGQPGAVSSQVALEASIGAYVEDLIATGDITRLQQREVQAILEARFQSVGIQSDFVKNFKTLAYISTMGHVTSALSQISDVAFSLYENGVFDTMVAGAKAVTRQSGITRADLGLEQMAEEFRDTGKLHKALDATFKLVGIHYLDMVGKETLVNAKFARMQREAAAGNLSAKSRNIIDRSFGPAQSGQVIADLAAGKKTEDTLFAVYTVLADYQPLTQSEYPEYYLRHPNGRIFYMLKSFTLKQIDAFRREGITKIVNGNAKQKIEGARNLVHLAGLLFLVGCPVDWLKDFIMGRRPQMDDIMVDNLFKLMGVNRWALWRFRESKNPVEAALLFVAPPAPFLVYPATDLIDVATKISEGDDIDVSKFETWRALPFVGSPVYWWMGGGADKIEAREKKQSRSR